MASLAVAPTDNRIATSVWSLVVLQKRVSGLEQNMVRVPFLARLSRVRTTTDSRCSYSIVHWGPAGLDSLSLCGMGRLPFSMFVGIVQEGSLFPGKSLCKMPLQLITSLV